MDLGKMEHEETPQVISTGITNVDAVKSGNVVTLILGRASETATTPGWQTIGTLPSSLYPKIGFRFNLLNDDATQSTQIPVEGELNTSGVLRYYAFSNQMTNRVSGTVTYIAAN